MPVPWREDDGLTTTMYAIVKNVVTPAMASREILVPWSRSAAAFAVVHGIGSGCRSDLRSIQDPPPKSRRASLSAARRTPSRTNYWRSFPPITSSSALSSKPTVRALVAEERIALLCPRFELLDDHEGVPDSLTTLRRCERRAGYLRERHGNIVLAAPRVRERDETLARRLKL